MCRVNRVVLDSARAVVSVEEIGSNKRLISVTPKKSQAYMDRNTVETSYSLELVECFLQVVGPFALCDHIARDEDPSYVKMSLEESVLPYLDTEAFLNSRILDFGCGAGTSTMNLRRMFSDAEIVGVDIDSKKVDLARRLAVHHGFKQLDFLASPDGSTLPSNIHGVFDFVVLCDVYEHLLPQERPCVLSLLWSRLRKGGILFIKCPNRLSPMERHSSGLPFINYLPALLAFPLARLLSKRIPSGASSAELLRSGIRGGTVTEIMGILKRLQKRHSFNEFGVEDEDDKPHCGVPELLNPRENLDRIDIWYRMSQQSRQRVGKRVWRLLLKAISKTTGVVLTPSLSLAIRKGGLRNNGSPVD